MAKVIWTIQAEQNLFEILNYWVKKEKKEYAEELLDDIKKRIKTVSKDIYIGQKTDVEKIRIVYRYNYSIFYKIIEEAVYILLLTNNIETVN